MATAVARTGNGGVAKARDSAATKARGGPTAGISADAVRKATGKGWDQWLSILDKAGARKWLHKDIATYLHETCGVGEWWCQMVTVGYEQARGLRAKHQKGDFYEISGSKTVEVPVASLFDAWADAKKRGKWLPAGLDVRKATRPKSMRITWEPAGERTSVSVNFYPKGAGKSYVSLNHGKLKSAAAGSKMKKYWAGRLSALKEMLEG